MSTPTTVEKINMAALNFLQQLTTSQTYETIVHEAVKLVNGTYGSLVLAEEGELKRVYTTLPQSEEVPFRKKGYTWTVYKTRKALVQSDSQGNPIRPHLKALGIKTTLLIPLSNRNECMGVLIVNSEKDEEYNLKELSSLELFGSLASMAIRKTQLYDEVKNALEVRDLFISMASHELRTPLTTIMGYVQMLHRKLDDQSTTEGRWVTQLYYESIRLNQLVGELLTVNRIKQGEFQYEFKESSLREIIGRAVSSFHFTHPDRQIIFEDKLKSDDPDLVVADFDKLIQVVTNLVDNAVKFSPTDKPINIRLLSKGPQLLIQIIDHGRGIPSKDLPKIYEGFYRGANNKIEGMGLGLFLVKNIIDQHHGDIKVKSKIDKGTTFEVILPKAYR